MLLKGYQIYGINNYIENTLASILTAGLAATWLGKTKTIITIITKTYRRWFIYNFHLKKIIVSFVGHKICVCTELDVYIDEGVLSNLKSLRENSKWL